MQYIESSVIGIRSAVITLKRRVTPLRFILFPMVHIGEPEFFRSVAARAGECELFAEDRRIEVITSDAFHALSDHGPFDLLFADSGVRDRTVFAALVDLLCTGGRIVMDDVTPERVLPSDSPLRVSDLKRQFFSSDPRLVSTEVVLPDLHNSLLVGTRTA
jgi:predicted O-methyltransferase YrrM